MKFTKRLGISFIFVFCICRIVFTQSLIQKIDNHGYVDWEKFVIHSSGVGAINVQEPGATQRIQALQNAKQAAIKNLLKAVEALTFDTDSTVMDALVQSSLSSAHLQEIVQGFNLVDTRSMSDMSIEVEIELPITGRLSEVLLPKICGKGQLRLSNKPLCPTCVQPWPEGKPVPEGVTLLNLAEGLLSPNGTPYTGLIIDARGLGINPAITPKILDEDGNEIYGTNYVDRDNAIATGIVTYKDAIKKAINDSRVGSEPLLFRGLKTSGLLKADVIISNSDAALIHSAAHIQNFLRECKVVFIID
ncbi:MAG: hypothetical protein ACE5JB_14810 [bacterium]